jgi:hypothetical protein
MIQVDVYWSTSWYDNPGASTLSTLANSSALAGGGQYEGLGINNLGLILTWLWVVGTAYIDGAIPHRAISDGQIVAQGQ